jgi:nucleoside permease NupC
LIKTKATFDTNTIGLPFNEAWEVAQQMAKKIVTNEFVVMGEISNQVNAMTPHHRAVISTFLVSFANFSTIGMIIGTLKGIVDKKFVCYNFLRHLLCYFPRFIKR